MAVPYSLLSKMLDACFKKPIRMIKYIPLNCDPSEFSCEYGNEPLGSIKGGTFFDQLNDC